jgi:ABC-type nitrate/sulfonate/bicarbonate transport system substrate-binding protein
MIAFLVARSDFVEENADILDCVNQSVQEAISRFQDPARRDEYLGILGEFTGLTAEQISTIQLANLTHIADPDLLAKTAQMLVDLEVTEELVDVEGLITESAQS